MDEAQRKPADTPPGKVIVNDSDFREDVAIATFASTAYSINETKDDVETFSANQKSLYARLSATVTFRPQTASHCVAAMYVSVLTVCV